jgi:hypothetical protein
VLHQCEQGHMHRGPPSPYSAFSDISLAATRSLTELNTSANEVASS